MAASGFTPISLYYSTTASAAPTAGNLTNGELAINITDGKLYYKDNTGVVRTIADRNGIAGGSNTQVQFNSSGSLAGSANLTFDGTTLTPSALTVTGATALNGGTTIGDASGDALTINSSAVSIPNGLNFDSNTFVIDATNNRVGVGTSSPAVTFEVKSASGNIEVARFGGTVSDRSLRISGFAAGGQNEVGYNLNAPGASGVNGTLSFSTNSTERMRIDSSGNVGIGTSSPSQKLDVAGNLGNVQISLNGADIRFTRADANYITAGSTNGFLSFRTSGDNERMRLDASGNLGLGATPSAWNSTWRANEIQRAGNAVVSNALNSIGITSNAYLDSVGWKYGATGAANFMAVGNGFNQFAWYTAPSGTAGSAITFTQAMTLNASGNLSVGTTVGNAKFTVQGNTTIQLFDSTGGNQSDIDFPDAQTLRIRSYNASGANITFATNPSGGGNTERMRIDSSGNVGIGTSSPSTRLHVASAGTTGIRVQNTASSGSAFLQSTNTATSCNFGVDATGGYIETAGAYATVFYTNSAERMRISAAGGLSVGTTADPGAGAIFATGNITAYYSDARLKTKIGNIENALAKVRQIETMVYHANETAVALGYDASKVEVGVTAQSVQAVQPEAVKPAPIDEKYLTVQYERLVPLLIEAIKELENKIAKLENK